ncbi:hypothetical protein QBC39DRAFT_343408 [Podospora conica]|nr:hypothetical protein QBC39DRAFT_343408 [Schizothecium conicum]
MHLHEIDAQTLNVIIQTQLDDIRELARTNDPKGKGQEGGAEASLNAVLDMYRAELSATAQSLGDQAMCRSIATAVKEDAGAIRAAMALEEQSIRDRNMAFMLSGGAPNHNTPAGFQAPMPPVPATGLDDYTMEWLEGQNVAAMNAVADLYSDNGQSAAGPSSRGAGKGTVAVDESWKACGVCMGKYRFHDIVKAPCNHEFCQGCLKDMFTNSITDESLYPPQCCRQPIPMSRCGHLFSPQLRGQFAAKKIEYETPNRTYCSRANCSIFVPPSHIKEDIAACVQCRTKTCTICKQAAHVNMDCPKDPATEATIRLATEQSWQRCPACQMMVSLKSGCYHICELEDTSMKKFQTNLLTPSSLLQLVCARLSGAMFAGRNGRLVGARTLTSRRFLAWYGILGVDSCADRSGNIVDVLWRLQSCGRHAEMC